MTHAELLLAIAVIAALSGVLGYRIAELAHHRRRDKITEKLLRVEELIADLEKTIESLEEVKP